MEIIFIRSPYFIEVNETSQVGSKVELFIWHKGETEPTTPTYTLSKKIASTTQIKNIYNISNYVKEFINIIKPISYTAFEEEDNNNWCYVKVKRYKEVSLGSYTLLTTTTYSALNGYTNYLDGYNGNNFLYDPEFFPMTNSISDINYKHSNTINSLNFFIDYTNDTDIYEVKYTSLNGGYNTIDTMLNGNTETQYLFSIPTTQGDPNFVDGNKMSILKNGVEIFIYNYRNECEPKYQPLLCSFINRFGGWEYITFFKARTETFDVKNKEYQLLPNDINYSIDRGESKMFNFEAKQTIKINTGWVDEQYNELIKDLMTSETILLDSKPVKLKTMSTDLKTSLQDKMINYQIDFEFNYNQINNVI